MEIKVEYKPSYAELMPICENDKLHFKHIDNILKNLKAEGII